MSTPRNPDGTFKKGVSGNPNGKPKGAIHRKTIVRRWIDAKIKLTPEQKEQIKAVFDIDLEGFEMTAYDLSVLMQTKAAMQGDAKAFQIINELRFTEGSNTEGLSIEVRPPIEWVDGSEPEKVKR